MATRPLPVPKPALTAAELIAALRRGNPDALGVVYQTHAPALLLVARRLLGDAAEAEDVVQDAFVALPEALGRYEERGQFGGWLRTVVVRLALMRLRQGRRLAAAPLERMAARGPDAEGPITLAALLARLPEEQRTVVVLRTIEGYAAAEVAELLGIRRNTVDVRLHRALARLRALLEEEQR